MDETLLRKTMPNSMEAEKAVIASMLMDEEAIMSAGEMLTPEDFYGSQYGILFKAITQMYGDGCPIDLMTLKDQLGHMDVPPELSSIEFLKDLFAKIVITNY